MVTLQEADLSKLELLLQKKIGEKDRTKKEDPKFDEIQHLLSRENNVEVELNRSISSFEGQNIISCDSSNTKEIIVSLAKKILSYGKSPVLVLTSVNYAVMQKLLEEKDISQRDVFIMDTVTKNIFNEKDTKQIKFIDSLRNLTQLQIKMLKLIEANSNLIFVFDSLNVLELYHDEKIIFKFVYSLVKLLRRKQLPGFYLVHKSKSVPKLTQFFDDLIEIKRVA
jgi:hypothetical protein